MIRKIMGWFMALGLLAGLALLAYTVTVQDQNATAHRRTLPTMELVGEFMHGNQSIYLYGFDFEGKRCIWMTKLKHAGLTCWDKDDG
ncbi:MAG: hypothetical protein V3S25_11085 [Nitrospirales bacterium]